MVLRFEIWLWLREYLSEFQWRGQVIPYISSNIYIKLVQNTRDSGLFWYDFVVFAKYDNWVI